MCYKLQPSLQTDQFFVTVEEADSGCRYLEDKACGVSPSLKVRNRKPSTAGESLSN